MGYNNKGDLITEENYVGKAESVITALIGRKELLTTSKIRKLLAIPNFINLLLNLCSFPKSLYSLFSSCLIDKAHLKVLNSTLDLIREFLLSIMPCICINFTENCQ